MGCIPSNKLMTSLPFFTSPPSPSPAARNSEIVPDCHCSYMHACSVPCDLEALLLKRWIKPLPPSPWLRPHDNQWDVGGYDVTKGLQSPRLIGLALLCLCPGCCEKNKPRVGCSGARRRRRDTWSRTKLPQSTPTEIGQHLADLEKLIGVVSHWDRGGLVSSIFWQ